MTRIALNQVAPKIGDLDANIAASITAIRASISGGAALVVLPELSLTGYMFSSKEELRTVAITRDHPVFTAWQDEVASTDAVVVGGFAELGDDGIVYNSAAVVGKDGILAVHRKDHLWDKEKLIFTPGSVIPPVVETSIGKLGILICYDVEFPEMTRSLALRGADLIVVPTNWPKEQTPAGEHVPEVTIAMAAAHVNHVAVVCCDRSGLERGQEWNEASCAIDQDGWIVATAQNGVVLADLDLERSRDKQVTALVNAFGDRRPELYGVVTEAKADIEAGELVAN